LFKEGAGPSGVSSTFLDLLDDVSEKTVVDRQRATQTKGVDRQKMHFPPLIFYPPAVKIEIPTYCPHFYTFKTEMQGENLS
jgi:hypothetical protein